VSEAEAQNCATTSALLKIFPALAFDLTLSLSFSLALIIYARARVFKEYRLWRERKRGWRFFPLLVMPASQPPTRPSNLGEILKKRSGDAESFHDVFVSVGGAGKTGKKR
jgi:hypothetical protein